MVRMAAERAERIAVVGYWDSHGGTVVLLPLPEEEEEAEEERVRYVMYSAAKCSESVEPAMCAYAASSISSHTARLMAVKSGMEPLCMMVWRPKTKGWLFTVAMAVPDEARMCAKHTFVALLAHMLLNTGSLAGGWIVL